MIFGLDQKTVDRINGVLAAFPQIKKAVIYGSRAKGNFENGSDIDITFEGSDLTLEIMNRIDLGLDELMLPYTFDLSICSHIDNTDLLDHIKRVGRVFYQQ
jgi:uncharacterized protein